MQLTADYILVKPDPPEDTTASGLIYIPDTAKKKENRGTIILVGPGLPDEPMLAKPGEYILYQQYAGINEDYQGEPHLIMRQADKIALLG